MMTGGMENDERRVRQKVRIKMQIVCNIPKELYTKWEQSKFTLDEAYQFVDCIMKGTPLPEHHGRLIDADVLVDGLDYRKDFATQAQIEALNMAIAALKAEPCEDAVSREAVRNMCCEMNCEKELTKCAFRNICKYQNYVSALPSVTLAIPTCEDAVSRESVKEGMLKYGFLAPDMTVTEFVEDELPSVTPTRKKGEWVGIDEEPHEDYECNKCGYVCSTFTANIKPSAEYKFCPNCGADMRKEQE